MVDNRELVGLLSEQWPRRVAHNWCAAFAPNRRLGECRYAELEELAQLLSAWQIKPAGTRGYAKAEVTVGGIDTNELSSRTMEARRVPGLYFIGEVVDVTGWLGGYNFHWAWASGFAAGSSC
jgi:predicted flavoprotein YhiN